MSGHSKWHNIQRRKGKQDAARGQLFTKLSRDIYYAARDGGGNPETNFRLKMAVDKAKQNNLPADTISRTVAKATGSLQGVTYEELLYEGYGPNGVAVMVEIVTDNRNRTAADVRHIFSKRGGNLGETGCVSWMFNHVGHMVIRPESCPMSIDDLMLVVLEAGADDLREEEESYIVTTAVEAFARVRDALENAGVTIDDAELSYEPTTTIDVPDDEADPILDLMEALENNDDVQNVYANFSVAQE